ncbi:hypothetical protein ACFZAM_31895 [Streptomyces sp. NPDC008079]|uniref:hypothetical protein n=1 Tax=Streptomyces sp. NPDC008079 TaxID=3364806 RepID=UPI0036EBB48A
MEYALNVTTGTVADNDPERYPTGTGTATLHAAPCAYCDSDGHAACQHPHPAQND